MNMDFAGSRHHPMISDIGNMTKRRRSSSTQANLSSKNSLAHPKTSVLQILETKSRFEVNGADKKQPLTQHQVVELAMEIPGPGEGILQSLIHLRNAKRTAIKCDESIDLFAVALTELLQKGIVGYQLRWLYHRGLIERSLMPRGTETVFEFQPGAANEDAFVLTENGEKFLGFLEQEILRRRTASQNPKTKVIKKPSFSFDTHVLKFGDIIVKKFRWAASNQERVLMAFEEEGWPRRVDDPLSPQGNICPKRRLHDTIKCLNRRQENKIIRFRGDGTGTGVLWELWDHIDSPIVAADKRPDQ